MTARGPSLSQITDRRAGGRRGALTVQAGQAEQGRVLLERVVERGTAVARTEAGLGDAQRAAGDVQLAREPDAAGPDSLPAA